MAATPKPHNKIPFQPSITLHTKHGKKARHIKQIHPCSSNKFHQVTPAPPINIHPPRIVGVVGGENDLLSSLQCYGLSNPLIYRNKYLPGRKGLYKV